MRGPDVFLAGFMGAGKSTVGPLLARALGVPFADLDAAVEALAGASVASILARDGEPAFRDLEASALASLPPGGLVVALGGGALLRPANLALARRRGAIVYLRAAPATLAARLDAEPGDRPLLGDARGDALAARITALLAARRAGYEAADRVVDTDGRPAADVARAVLDALAEARSEAQGREEP
jgi:shikimate kinase